MFGIGWTEILIVLVVALLVLGPKRLPEIAKGLGRGLRDFRKAMSGLDLDDPPQPPPTRPPPAPSPEPRPQEQLAPPSEAPEAPAPAAEAPPAGAPDDDPPPER